MPTVMRSGPYRFFFYAGDRDEPAHIHVERDDRIAKFRLDPARLQNSGGFGRLELRKICSIIQLDFCKTRFQHSGHRVHRGENREKHIENPSLCALCPLC